MSRALVLSGGGFAGAAWMVGLIEGLRVVTVVSPIPLNPYLRAQLDAELATLGGATVNVIVADDRSLAAIGPDPLSVETVSAAVQAGAAQAHREAVVWS